MAMIFHYNDLEGFIVISDPMGVIGVSVEVSSDNKTLMVYVNDKCRLRVYDILPTRLSLPKALTDKKIDTAEVQNENNPSE